MTDRALRPLESPGPIGPGERIEAIDILRGVAVLMIFVVNIKLMTLPMSLYFSDDWPGWADRMVVRAQHFLVEEQFFTIFTALFGCGLAIFCERAVAAGRPGWLIYRRLFVLLLIGLAHAVLIWFGDILTGYAVAGFAAALFVRAPPRRLYLIAALLLAARVAAEFSPVEALIAQALHLPILPTLGADGATAAMEHGVFLGPVSEQIHLRLMMEAAGIVMSLPLNTARILAVMLIGIALHRQGFFGGWTLKRYLVAAGVGLAAALLLRVVARLGVEGLGDGPIPAALRLLGHFAQAFFYSATVMAVVKAGAKLSPLAAAGRMALSNYIACSIVGTTIAYSSGLALYGRLTPAPLMAVVAATWLAILIWSPLWLRHFRFGPLEWAWRSMTYGRLEPLRIAAKPPARGALAE